MMLASYFGIKSETKKITSPESEEEQGVQLLTNFPQDPMILPKGDLSIGSGKKGIVSE